ncbi:MAG: methyltransferase [Thermogemmata sp.]|nr:methyltransferase [Thermogemmata sp.]
MMKATSIKDVFQMADRYCESALLQQAHAAGIFELLRYPRTVDDVAAAKGWLRNKTAIMLDALAALGLLLKEGKLYRNSPVADNTLVREAPGYIGDLVEHERLQWRLWEQLDAILRSSVAVPGQQDLSLPANEYANEVFHRAMMQLAKDLVDLIARLPEWTRVRHVIDLAGGHGMYLAEVAKQHPHLTGEVWDLPSARKKAEHVIAAYGIAERVRFVERDIRDQKSYEGVTADAVMLHHCLHHFDQAGVRAIAEHVADLLPSSGLVTILDVHLESDRITPPQSALFSFYMMVNTVHGQVHPTDEIVSIFTEAGFAVETQLLDSLEDDYLIIGRKR